jgi:hypothetical protein
MTLNPILDINTFSGFIFQLASVVQRKKRSVYEVYAGGGRYDPLVCLFDLLLLNHLLILACTIPTTITKESFQ